MATDAPADGAVDCFLTGFQDCADQLDGTHAFQNLVNPRNPVILSNSLFAKIRVIRGRSALHSLASLAVQKRIRLTRPNENYKTKSNEPNVMSGTRSNMARPKASDLTERELDVMHVFWDAAESPLTAADAQQRLAAAGRELAYTTVATLVRILLDKEFLVQTNDQRPFAYKPGRSFEDVSRSIVGNLVDRVFQGSREQLLLRLVETKRLTAKERALLEGILKEKK